MKQRSLNERQLKAMYQIINLANKISPDHWFTNHVLSEVGSGTLGALEKKGYVRQETFVRNHTHWQWTGKEIENEIGCIEKIIEGYKKELIDFEKSTYLYSWCIDNCKYKINFWEDRIGELRT